MLGLNFFTFRFHMKLSLVVLKKHLYIKVYVNKYMDIFFQNQQKT